MEDSSFEDSSSSDDVDLDMYNVYEAKLKLDKKAVPYFNSRALRYSPALPVLQRRHHSVDNVASLYYRKKQYLIDEEVTHMRTIIHQNKVFTQKLIGKPQKKHHSQIKKLAKEAEKQFQLFHKECKQHSWVLEKHKRNLSQPKYKATTLEQKGIKKYKTQQSYPLDEKFFRFGWGKLQNEILQSKELLTSNLHSLKTCEETNQLLYCKNFWVNIIYQLKKIRIASEFDIFSKDFIIKNLKKYYINFQSLQISRTNFLFEDSLMDQESEQEEKLQTRRLQKLSQLSKQLGIQLGGQNTLDIKRAVFAYRRLSWKIRSKWQGEQLKILTLVRRIQKKLAYSPSESNFYDVEYHAGWKMVLSEEEIKQRHPQAYKKYFSRKYR